VMNRVAHEKGRSKSVGDLNSHGSTVVDLANHESALLN
jgi:hypothetical protein